MPKKRYVEELIPDAAYYDEYTFEGPIVIILEKLSRSLQSAYDLGYAKVHIKKNYGYDDSFSFSMVGTRPETEAEIIKRVDKTRKARETKAKNKIKRAEQSEVERRILYKELQEEFGEV